MCLAFFFTPVCACSGLLTCYVPCRSWLWKVLCKMTVNPCLRLCLARSRVGD
jgi:hypothetical protein